MSYSESDLLNEIRATRDRRLAEGQEVVKAWLVREVMLSHPGVAGADADFYVACANMKVGDAVRKVVNEDRAAIGRSITEPTFAGWDHLQQSYLVERGDGPVIVPTERMTEAELLAKADFLEKLAIANREHALEIRRYVADRRALKADHHA